MQCAGLLSVHYWKELHSSVLIAQTMVAALVKKLETSRAQGLPQHIFYDAFIAETKHIYH